MDPRLYTYQRRTPRINNPTFKSQFVTDALHLFNGGIHDTSHYLSKIPQTISKDQHQEQVYHNYYHPPQISKIRASFENNRSKVPLSNLSAYGRQIMFPTQKNISNYEDYKTISHNNPSNPQNSSQTKKFFKKELILDNKQLNYLKQLSKMNDQFITNSRIRMNKSVDLSNNEAAGKPSFIYDDKDHRHYRYKHSYDQEIQKQNNNNEKNRISSFKPARLNYADQMKGIL